MRLHKGRQKYEYCQLLPVKWAGTVRGTEGVRGCRMEYNGALSLRSAALYPTNSLGSGCDASLIFFICPREVFIRILTSYPSNTESLPVIPLAICHHANSHYPGNKTATAPNWSRRAPPAPLPRAASASSSPGPTTAATCLRCPLHSHEPPHAAETNLSLPYCVSLQPQIEVSSPYCPLHSRRPRRAPATS